MVSFIFLLNSLSRRSPRSGVIPTPFSEPGPGQETIDQILITRPPTNTTNELRVMSTDPKDNAVNVSSKKPITITFNREVSADEIVFNIAPDVNYTIKTEGNKFIITPLDLYFPGDIYSYFARQKISKVRPQTFSFTVAGPTPEKEPDTAPIGDEEVQRKFQLENHPDIYLVNQAPFETSAFYISSRFETTPTEHFVFRVELKGADRAAARLEFENWLKFLGLTEDQIGTLDIEYIN